MNFPTKRILITGTTSGIGLGMLKTYVDKGWQVTAINRRTDAALESQFPNVQFYHFDVREHEAVKKFLEEAVRLDQLPSLYFLSAGINKVDNAGEFSRAIFQEVMDTNLMGVLNFVAVALPHHQKKPAVFVAVSSTSNIFPNPNCLGYYISKLALHEIFTLLDSIHKTRGVRFKSLVLGPIATNIFVGGQLTSKVQMKVREMITMQVEQAVPPIVCFIESNRQAFFYSKRAVLLFRVLRIVKKIYPNFYKGSAPKS